MQTLHHLVPIRLVGEESRQFLQGQLSQDLDALQPDRLQLASCNSAQGRVQAVLRIIERGDGIWLLLPADLHDSVVTRLRKYVLRAKTRIEDARTGWSLSVASRAELHTFDGPAAMQPGEHVQHDQVSVIRWPDLLTERYLVLQPHPASDNAAAPATADSEWLLADIRAGLPQVFAATYENFVAQMLNLDLLDGISFTKGCYTGQEIIARAHYRGTIKRRMFRFTGNCVPPEPGTRLLAGETHAGEVVMSAATGNGSELLAVLTLAQRDAALHAESSPDVLLTPLPLPYDVAEPATT